MEGVCFSQKQCADVLNEIGVPTNDMMACGGGARSGLWRQMLADIYGYSIKTAKASNEGPALGAAILAGVGAGVFGSVQETCAELVIPDTLTEPRAAENAAYAGCFELYLRLYPALKDSFSALSDL